MRNLSYKLLLLLSLMIWVTVGQALVSEYIFAGSMGTYNELTDGNNHGGIANNEDVFNDITIGFDFTYNSIVYTNLSIASNGFIAMGPAVVTSATALSTGASNNVIAPLHRDIMSRPDGSLTSGIGGAAPNRVFTIQWHNYRRIEAPAANDTLNFQMKLYETTNIITFNYGSIYADEVPVVNAFQCGLRGASNADYNNRSTTTDWDATTAGTSNADTCVLGGTVIPANGLIFSWYPLSFPAPTSLIAVGGATGITLTWVAPEPLLPNLAGYKVYRDGVSITPSPIPATMYVDSNIMNNFEYDYYIVAIYTNPNGVSEPSNTESAAGGETLNPVTDLQYSVAMDNVSLTWIPPGGQIYQDWIHYDDGFNDNSIGTGDVIDFDVAARFTQTELSALADRYVTKVRFFPAEANCEYSVKIWTGGTSQNDPGTLSLTIPVPNPTIDAWNEVDLTAPIQVPSTGELWVGINCNAQTGYPAGCDDGPSVPYKGNLIYFNNAWTILTELNEDLDYNWNIQAFVTNFIGRETILSNSIESQPEPALRPVTTAKLKAIANPHSALSFTGRDETRNMTGYRVYRDDAPIETINEITTSNYTDMGLVNGSYTYFVTAIYETGESIPCDPITATVNVPTVPIVLEDSFETYDDFALSFGNWQLDDRDESATAVLDSVDFANEGSPMAFMVFNPGATAPPMTGLTAHTGDKMLASFGATTPPNDDWILSPRIHLGIENQISFWAKSYNNLNGLERFRVGITTALNPIPAAFFWVSGPNYISAPLEWTRFSYPVPAAYNAQNVFYGIKCESNGGSIFLLDDIKIQGYSASGNDNEVTTITETALLGNYPNPFNPETVISYNIKSDQLVTLEVYNLKGQKIRTLVNGKTKAGSHSITWKGDDDNGKQVTSGVYFYKMNSGKFTSSKKMILLK